MGKIVDALAALGPDEATRRCGAAAEWLATPLNSILMPSIIDSVLGKTDKGRRRRLKQNGLCTELTLFYEQHIQQFCGDATYKVTDSVVSKFRSGMTQADPKLALLFSLWMADSPRPFRETHDATRLDEFLSISNPLAQIEAFILAPPGAEQALKSLPTEMRHDRPLIAAESERNVVQPLLPPTQLAMERQVSLGAVELLGLETTGAEYIRHDFFAGGECAHFLVYRRGSKENEILKGFLSINPLAGSGSTANVFAHFYKDSVGDFRQTYGFVLTLRNAHYFVGGTGNGEETATWNKETNKRPHLSQGLKFIVINRGGSVMNGNVWGGLFLSHGQGYQPIAGRCVLLRADCADYQSAQIGPIDLASLGDDMSKFAAAIFAGGAPSEQFVQNILQAMDNSFEPPDEPGGDPILAGPLTIVSPMR